MIKNIFQKRVGFLILSKSYIHSDFFKQNKQFFCFSSIIKLLQFNDLYGSYFDLDKVFIVELNGSVSDEEFYWFNNGSFLFENGVEFIRVLK